jgi:hypothetical protein
MCVASCQSTTPTSQASPETPAKPAVAEAPKPTEAQLQAIKLADGKEKSIMNIDELPVDKKLRISGKQAFETNFPTLVQERPNGKKFYMSNDPNQVSRVMVNENWFDAFTTTTYIMNSGNVNKLLQITLSTTNSFDKTKASISKHLGKPVSAGLMPEGSPTKNYGLWEKDSYQYNLQEFSNRVELYVMEKK